VGAEVGRDVRGEGDVAGEEGDVARTAEGEEGGEEREGSAVRVVGR
jgi:hypothetical protein